MIKFIREKTGLTRISLIAIVAIILGVVTLIVAKPEPKTDAEADQVRERQVVVASIGSFAGSRAPLPVIGAVESKSEARIRTETQGEITRVYKKLGDTVRAGEIIAEIDNAFERATVIQAEGAVDAARAGLEKVTGGARDQELTILRVGRENAESTVNEAKIFAVNTVKSAFTTTDDLIRNLVDPMFTDPQESNPQINFSVKDAQLEIDLENGRMVIEERLNVWNEGLGTLLPETFSSTQFTLSENNMNRVRTFLDELALAVNTLTPSLIVPQSTIDAWKGNIFTARNSLNGALVSVSGAKDNLNNKEAALEIAKQQLDIGETGGSEEDVAATEANLKSAQGALRAAQANFERTIIRTPISGTINVLDLKRGDFVSIFELVVVVSNNEALEITTFVTAEDKNQIKIGSEVLIDNRWQGIVTNVAPAVQERTKKVEVKIGILEDKTTLTNGQTVQLEIERVLNSAGITEQIIIPISALKVGFENTVVFTVDENDKLVSHEVTVGPLLGENVVIEEGVTPEMKIVLDARGLKAGQRVYVKR